MAEPTTRAGDAAAAGSGAEAPRELTPEELASYSEVKDRLAAAVKKHGNLFFAGRGDHGYGGLLNQGATCYLNSLVQSLFATPEFRRRIYDWEYDRERDGPAESCIPLQLQKLFVNMQSSEQSAVATKGLTTSFGWTQADSFRQHDVQELCRVLFDALERATAGYTLCNDLYEGVMVDFLECQTCHYKRQRSDKFMDVELTVSGCKSADESLGMFTTPEVLAGPNQWLCPECDAKVDALKGLGFQQLPNILTLHLKRFVFDFELMRRVKVNDKFAFPQVLDMAPYLNTAPSNNAGQGSAPGAAAAKDDKSQADGDATVESATTTTPSATADAEGEVDGDGSAEKPQHLYELYSVMIHSGTAMGGHYFAYIKPPGSDQWFEFNDAIIRPLTPEDVAACFEEALDGSPEEPDAGGEGDGDATTSGGAAPTGVEATNTSTPPATEGGDTAASTTAASGLTPAPAEGSAEEPAGMAASTRRAVTATSSNAYLLMYRRIDDPHAGAAAAAVPVPERLLEPVHADNAEHDELRKAFEIRQHLSELHVFTQDGRKVTLDAPNAMRMGDLTDLAYAKLHSPEAVEAANKAARDAIEARMAEREANKVAKEAASAASDGDAGDTSAGAGASAGAGDSAGDGDDGKAADGDDDVARAAAVVLSMTVTSFPREDVRLRKYVRGSRRATDAYDGREDLTVIEAGLFPACDMLLETRSPGAEWKPYNPNECVIAVRRWDTAAGAVIEGEGGTAAVTVDGDLAATLGKLKVAIAAEMGIPTVMQRLIHVNGDRVRVLLGDDNELRKDFGVWSGEDVIVELIGDADGETEAGPSAAASFHDAERNVVSIGYNTPLPAGTGPPSNTDVDYDRIVLANRSQTLAELKAAIAKDLGMDPLDIHVRRNQNGARLKDEAQTLRDLELVDSSIVYVARGACLRPDESMLKVYRYTPGTKNPWEFLLETPCQASMRIDALKRRLAEAVKVAQPACVRLRDKSGRNAGKIFRSERTARQDIPRLSDGREIALQVLDEPETMGKRDIVIAVRRWKPLTGKLTTTREIVIDKRTTVAQLRAALHDRFNVGVAVETSSAADNAGDEEKGGDDSGGATSSGAGAATATPSAETTRDSAAGGGAAGGGAAAASASAVAASGTSLVVEATTPEEKEAVKHALSAVPSGIGLVKKSDFDKLSIKTIGKLKWNDPTLVDDEVISARPLGVRDGNTVLFRDEREFAVFAVRNPDAAVGKTKPGTGARGGKGRAPKPWERGGARVTGGGGITIAGGGSRFGGMPETGIKIHTPFDSPKKESSTANTADAAATGEAAAADGASNAAGGGDAERASAAESKEGDGKME